MVERVLGYGVIGTGVYCDHYFGTLGPVFKNLRPVGCSDLNVEAAKAAAARWNVPKVYTTEEMLNDPEVDIVIILTNPASHYSLTMAALKAGKHVYCEKPLADSLEQANEIVEFAAEKGLFVGAAPDTFLTPEFQTVRKLLDEGAIGKVISVTANYVGPGADLWHPNAGYLYKKGVGPALDMGPYFLTSLVTLLGPIESLFCYANRGWDVRRIWGKDVDVEVNTNYCAVLKFENGVVGNLNLTYDEWKSSLPGLEIYGTEGVLFAPDPNAMMGPIKLLKAEDFKNLVNGKGDNMGARLGAIYGPESMALFTEIETLASRVGNQRGSGDKGQYQALVEGPWELIWTPSGSSELLAVQPDTYIGDTGVKLISAEVGPISAKVTLQLPELWEDYKTLDDYDLQLVGVRLKDGTKHVNIYSYPMQVEYTDIDNLILELDYSSHQILQPDQVDALIFASNFPWARTLTDNELIILPIG